MKHTAHKDKSRVIGARIEGSFNENAAEKLLTKALKAGVITQFDTGRGFSGTECRAKNFAS